MVRYFFIFSFFYFTINLHAQQKITQGKVVFDITYKNLPPMLAMQQDLLPKQQVVYFKDSLMRIESSRGGQTQNITIQNTATGDIFVLLEIYNKKFALIKHDSDLAAMKKEFGMDTIIKDINVHIIDTVVRNIAGFPCKKAVINKKVNGINTKTDCWFTQQLPAINKHNNDEFKNISGFLMQYTINDNGINTTFKARMVQELKLQYSFFTIPENFDIVTEDQLVRLLNFYKSQFKESDN